MITFTGLNISRCALDEPDNAIHGPTTQGSGTASASVVIPTPTCTGAGDAWQFTMPRWSAEAQAGLESPLDPLSVDSGAFLAVVNSAFVLRGTVDETTTVTITVEGTHSASAETEEFAFKSNEEAATLISDPESFAFLFVTSEDPSIPPALVTVWNFDSPCVNSNRAGRVDACSYSVHASLSQVIEFVLHPGYELSFRLDLKDSLAVSAQVAPMPEPAGAILLFLGLIGLAGSAAKTRIAGRIAAQATCQRRAGP